MTVTNFDDLLIENLAHDFVCSTNDTIFEEMKKEYMAQQEGKGPVIV